MSQITVATVLSALGDLQQSSEKPIPPLMFFIGGFMSIFFMIYGGIWARNPKLLVQLHRRIFIGDYCSQTAEWERKMSGLEGRMCGFVFFIAGMGILYLLLKVARII